MSSAPSELPEWASSGAIVRPSDAQIAAGWAPAQKPPAQFVNWWENLVWQWLSYLFSAIGVAVFGDGSDGSHVMDGTASVPGCSLSGSTYLATRDCYFVNLTINSGITFTSDNRRIYGTGVLTNNGHIQCDGNTATTRTGAVPISSGTLLGGTAGGNGGTGTNSGTVPGLPGVAAQAGAFAGGGTGGNGGAGTSGVLSGGTDQGGLGGTNTGSTNNIRSLLTMLMGCGLQYSSGANFAATAIQGGTGGGGGSYGDNNVGGGATLASNGGGGGAGAGCVLLAFNKIVNNGSISANGGAGAPFQPSLSTGDELDTGAGGGGGGGWISVLHAGLSGSGTITAHGGAAGGAGLGPATVAQPGAAGTITVLDLSQGIGATPTGPHLEKGIATMSTTGSGSGVDYLDVVFITAFPDTNYNFDAAIYNSAGLFINWVLVSKTTSGMRIAIAAKFNGQISWKASE